MMEVKRSFIVLLSTFQLVYSSFFDKTDQYLLSPCPCGKQIAFEGIKGVSGAVALDDIEYTIGVNCAKMITDVKGKMCQWFLKNNNY